MSGLVGQKDPGGSGAAWGSGTAVSARGGGAGETHWPSARRCREGALPGDPGAEVWSQVGWMTGLSDAVIGRAPSQPPLCLGGDPTCGTGRSLLVFAGPEHARGHLSHSERLQLLGSCGRGIRLSVGREHQLWFSAEKCRWFLIDHLLSST